MRIYRFKSMKNEFWLPKNEAEKSQGIYHDKIGLGSGFQGTKI